MAHTVVLEIRCKAGLGPSIFDAVVASLDETRRFEGAERFEVYRDCDDPDHILVLEKWTRRQDQEAYVSWRTESGALEALASACTAPPRFLHLTLERE